MLKPGGMVVYYDCEYQPIHVRMGRAKYPNAEELARVVGERGGRLERVLLEGLPDPRMQNAALLGRVASLHLIEGLTPALVEEQLAALVPIGAREANLDVFRRSAATAQTA